jgi:hypothetical protein
MGFFGADFDLALALDAVAFFAGGEFSSLSSSRSRFMTGCGVRFLPMFDVVAGDDWSSFDDMKAESGTLALLAGRGEPARVGLPDKDWVSALDVGGRVIAGDEDGGDDKGEEDSVVGRDVAIVFVGVIKDFGACFCGV